MAWLEISLSIRKFYDLRDLNLSNHSKFEMVSDVGQQCSRLQTCGRCIDLHGVVILKGGNLALAPRMCKAVDSLG